MPISLLERRRIEAQFAKAIFDILTEETGRARAVELLSKAVIRLAIESGAAFAAQAGQPRDAEPPDLLAYADVLAVWLEDNALTIDLIAQAKNRLEFNVKRCRYAECTVNSESQTSAVFFLATGMALFARGLILLSNSPARKQSWKAPNSAIFATLCRSKAERPSPSQSYAFILIASVSR